MRDERGPTCHVPIAGEFDERRRVVVPEGAQP
jgi:hypothetical protein